MIKPARLFFVFALILVPMLLVSLFLIPHFQFSTFNFQFLPSPARAEPGPTQILYVNNQHPNALDTNPGTDESFPLKTVNKAISLATPGTKIIIYPGIYRETIEIENLSGTPDLPIALEAQQTGQAVISGSDVLTGSWVTEGRPGLYSHQWLYDWGLAPYPIPTGSSWELCLNQLFAEKRYFSLMVNCSGRNCLRMLSLRALST